MDECLLKNAPERGDDGVSVSEYRNSLQEWNDQLNGTLDTLNTVRSKTVARLTYGKGKARDGQAYSADTELETLMVTLHDVLKNAILLYFRVAENQNNEFLISSVCTDSSPTEVLLVDKIRKLLQGYKR
nr:hypothetical protein BaRGS_031616 [Batillaria attramentaria]